jgi:hypothetical protein
MTRNRVAVIVFAGIAAITYPASAHAQQFRSIDQLPGLIQQESANVTIANIGTVALSILYLDGGAWKTIQIPSGQYVTLPSQGIELSISFNDGAETKTVTLKRGTTNALYWNSGLNRWSIAPYDDVARPRSGSGFRSR